MQGTGFMCNTSKNICDRNLHVCKKTGFMFNTIKNICDRN